MGPGRGPLVYAIASGLQSRLKLSLNAVLAIGRLLFARQTDSGIYRHANLHTDKCLDNQTDRQTVVTNVGAGRFTLKLLARHERDKSMPKAGQTHAHLWLC